MYDKTKHLLSICVKRRKYNIYVHSIGSENLLSQQQERYVFSEQKQ